MERIRFHVFFKISLIGCSGLLSFSPNKEKKKKIVQGIKPAANVMKLYQIPFSCPDHRKFQECLGKKRAKFSANTTLRNSSPPCFHAAVYHNIGRE